MNTQTAFAAFPEELKRLRESANLEAPTTVITPAGIIPGIIGKAKGAKMLLLWVLKCIGLVPHRLLYMENDELPAEDVPHLKNVKRLPNT